MGGKVKRKGCVSIPRGYKCRIRDGLGSGDLHSEEFLAPLRFHDAGLSEHYAHVR